MDFLYWYFWTFYTGILGRSILVFWTFYICIFVTYAAVLRMIFMASSLNRTNNGFLSSTFPCHRVKWLYLELQKKTYYSKMKNGKSCYIIEKMKYQTIFVHFQDAGNNCKNLFTFLPTMVSRHSAARSCRLQLSSSRHSIWSSTLLLVKMRFMLTQSRYPAIVYSTASLTLRWDLLFWGSDCVGHRISYK
jgi:hypothetical protein